MRTAFGNEGRRLRTCPRCRVEKMMLPFEQACIQCVLDEMNDMVQQAAGMRNSTFGAYDFARTTRAADAGFTATDWADFKQAQTAQEKLDDEIQKAKNEAYRFQQKQQAYERAKEAFRQRAAPPPPQAAKTLDLDMPMLRRLLQLCHPDKHANSQASQTATHFLLGLKDALERSQR